MTRRPSRPTVPDDVGGVSRRTVLGVTATGLAVAAVHGRPAAALGPQLTLRSSAFDVSVDATNGAVYRLANPSDALGTNYVINADQRPSFDVDDSRWLGDMIFQVRTATGSVPAVTSLSDDIRTTSSDGTTVTTSYSGSSARAGGIRNFSLVQRYTLTGTARDRLEWTFTVKNTSNASIELEDIGFPVMMNSFWNGGDQTSIYEQNVGRHSFVGKDGSYVYWQRPNGTGPFLVMVANPGTSLEFKNKARYGEGPFAETDPAWEGVVEFYVHSKNVATARAGKAAGYLPSTSLTLAPGASKTYGFTFRWAQDYQGIRDAVHDSGVVDVVSLPGMVIPTDLQATLAVRAKAGITGVEGQAGKNITVTPLGQRNGYTLFRLNLPTLGPQQVTVQYGSGLQSVLQYYAVQPIETLVGARSRFLADKQQAKTSRGYNGAFVQWDMTRQKQITWDDYPGGGWKTWMAGGSDDLGLAPALYLAQKNLTHPVQAEVSAIDYYLVNFILGYMQARTENGQRTWQVYRWFDGRDGTPVDQGVWRIYNYIHIANTYLAMYRVKKVHPSLQTSFTAAEYLTMALETVNAMFTKVPAGSPLGDTAARDLGLMGEQTYPELLASLQAEGRGAQAATLRRLLATKRDRLFAQKYPFASEASIDTTGFEACYTFASLYDNRALADKVQSASLSCRGIQPLWYFQGSDNRHMGESWWNLGYEAQLGAWQQQDYLETYASTTGSELDEALRSTYSGYLAGWATINSGQISSAAANYGAAAWIYQSQKGPGEGDDNYWRFMPQIDGWWAWSGECDLGFWGALRTAGVNVVDDKTVGLYAYGGTVTLVNGRWTISPKDGVRRRFTLFNAGKLGLSLERARYTSASVSTDRRDIRITVQAVLGATVSPDMTFTRLPAGSYAVTVDNGAVLRQFSTDGSAVTVSLQGLANGAVVRIAAVGATFGNDVSGAATLAASYTAPWNRLAALSDGESLGVALDDQTKIWGTYRPSGRPASDTVTASWASAVTVRAVSLAFWNDAPTGSGDGVALPARWSVDYLDTSGQWRPVTLAGGEIYPVNPVGQRSVVGFAPVSTTKLRLTFVASQSSSGERSAVAATELDVFS